MMALRQDTKAVMMLITKSYNMTTLKVHSIIFVYVALVVIAVVVHFYSFSFTSVLRCVLLALW